MITLTKLAKLIFGFLWRAIAVTAAFAVFFAVWMIALFLLGEAGAFSYDSGIIFGSYDFYGFDILGFVLAVGASVAVSWLLSERKLKPTLLFWGRFAAVVGAVLLLVFGGSYLADVFESIKINRFIASADETLYYGDSTIISGGMKGTRFEESVILIDYDRMRIAFLFNSYPDGEYREFELARAEQAIASPNLQIRVALQPPGALLTSYYPSEASDHRTTALQIIMADGSIYSLSDIVDEDTGFDSYLDLKSSQYFVE
jgi:hypothetical protein